MNINIELDDYLGVDQIKEICQEEVRNAVRSKLSREEDLQRFLTNSSYHLVWKAVEECCPDNLMELITVKIPDIINELSAYDVFRAKDVWDRDESKGWTLLQKALTEAEPLIAKQVQELIKKIDMYTIQDVICQQIQNVIDKLRDKEDFE